MNPFSGHVTVSNISQKADVFCCLFYKIQEMQEILGMTRISISVFWSFQSNTATCGGTYTGQSVNLKSPGFPANYPDSLTCEWYLEGPTGHYLTISFNNFSLQSTVDCSGDYVEIREYNASGNLFYV